MAEEIDIMHKLWLSRRRQMQRQTHRFTIMNEVLFNNQIVVLNCANEKTAEDEVKDLRECFDRIKLPQSRFKVIVVKTGETEVKVYLSGLASDNKTE